MKVRNVARRSSEKVELAMTPMIDIVFQLLIFFIMTFKISMPEGDFNIKMPSAAAAGPVTENDALPIKVRMVADADGRLAAVAMGNNALDARGDWQTQLRQGILGIVGDPRGPNSTAADQEVELDCDPQLRYEYAMDAITAVSGKVQEGNIVEIIQKIKFAPPKE